MPQYAIIPSPLGELTLAFSDEALSGLWFSEHKYPPRLQDWQRVTDHPVLRTAQAQLNAYFAGELKEFTIPLALPGTPFQQSVWQALRAIEYGRQTSYGELAEQFGLPMNHARAVGSAVGRNPISIIIPCHRVIGRSGTLTGYVGGLDRKRYLLALEQGHPPPAEMHPPA